MSRSPRSPMVLVDESGAPVSKTPGTKGQALRLIATLLANRALAERGQAFASVEARAIDVATTRVLVVHEREACVVPHAGAKRRFEGIGSPDATTCVLVFARSEASGLSAVAHVDSEESATSFGPLLARVGAVPEPSKPAEPSPAGSEAGGGGAGGGEAGSDAAASSSTSSSSSSSPASRVVDVWIVGGYGVKEPTSKENVVGLVEALETSPVECCVRLLLVWAANTTTAASRITGESVPAPRVITAAMDLDSGTVFPATFRPEAAPGPLWDVRGTRLFSPEGDLRDVYDAERHLLLVAPVPYIHMRRAEAEAVVAMSDREILERMSTSPHVEPPWFPASMRAIYLVLARFPRFQDLFAATDAAGKPKMGKMGPILRTFAFTRNESTGDWDPVK